MSLSYERLDVVQVKDPLLILKNKREYAVLDGGQQVSWKPYTTTSVSSSSIQFSTPPPSGAIVVNRKQYLLMPIRLIFTGTAPPLQNLLNPGTDAPRAYPLSSSIDVLQVTINNQGVSINLGDIIQGLLHFNTPECLSQLDFSMTPNILDQSQAYSQLNGTNRNPLGFYGDSLDQCMQGRGSFPFVIVQNTNTSAIVDMLVCEPIFLSPFYWGAFNQSGWYNVTTLDWNITFFNQAGNRMWSHDSVSPPGTTINNISFSFNNFSPAFSFSINQPFLLMQYVTPKPLDLIPWNIPITYPYFEVLRFITDSQNAIAPGAVWNFVSNNIQLNSIPRRIYVWVRERNTDLFSTCHHPDTYFSIEAPFSVQWENKNNLFSSATKFDLYKMSIKNHCNLSWTQWSGGPVYSTGSFTSRFGTVGSLICFEFGTDVGLDSLDAPGKLKQAMIQIQGVATNISNRTITPSLYIVVVNEGTFTIEALGKASTNIGVISSSDIMNAQQNPFINYNDIQCVNGGNFLSGLKNFGEKLLTGIKDVSDLLKQTKAISTITGAVPHPTAQAISGVARSLGYGHGGGGICETCRGKGCLGCRAGAELSREELRKRMR